MDVLDFIFYAVVLVIIGFYLFGPSQRKSGGSQLPYEKAVIRTDKGRLGFMITDKRLIRDIAVSPTYPQKEYRKYRRRMQILRILYLIAFMILVRDSRDYNKSVFLIGLASLVVSLMLRHVFYGKTSDEIAEEAAADQQLYEAVSTLNGWWYDSEWYGKYVQPNEKIKPSENPSGTADDSEVSPERGDNASAR